jgi:hypothetical protein
VALIVRTWEGVRAPILAGSSNWSSMFSAFLYGWKMSFIVERGVGCDCCCG